MHVCVGATDMGTLYEELAGVTKVYHRKNDRWVFGRWSNVLHMSSQGLAVRGLWIRAPFCPCL